MLSFHEWKHQQAHKDSKKHGVHKFYRERNWYFKAYGDYCKKMKE